ncbi:MAG: hypothetical protein ACXWG8_10280 [Usitatibacter sp.]
MNEGIKLQAMVQMQVNQSWGDAYAAMCVDGVARRASWENPRAFYKFEEGRGLVLVTGGGDQGPVEVFDAKVSGDEQRATDWVTLVPMTMAAITEELADGELVVGGIRFVASPVAVDEERDGAAIEAAQLAAQMELDAGPRIEEGCDFADAMECILLGGCAARPGRDTVYEVSGMGGRLVIEDDGEGALTAYLPCPDDLVAEDWMVKYPA